MGKSGGATHSDYDVVIIGGAIMGSATAFFLTDDDAFTGRVLVVEPDPSYAASATALSNSCIRQQFSHPLNVRISQFAADFVQDLRRYLGGDPRIPDLSIQNFGYLYLADHPDFAHQLCANAQMQRAQGAGTRVLTRAQIADAYPFYQLDDILLGSLNTRDEGYWDGWAVFDWLRRVALSRGVDYAADRVTGLAVAPGGDRIDHVTLASGRVIRCDAVVNAAGTCGAEVAALAGITLPVVPRKRYTWIARAAQPLDRELPLTVDPSGVHMRENGGGTYMIGARGLEDPDVMPGDFTMDHTLWQDHVWPRVASRIPQFEALRVEAEWVGHYDFNLLDQNAIVGPHPCLRNFLFLNGFSGHGLQQAPALGRAVAEWLIHGDYRSLDLRPFHFDRIIAGQAHQEQAVI